MTEFEIEQRRREDVAAVDLHARQLAAAQERLDDAKAKIDKFKKHVDNLIADHEAAQANLAAEQATYDRVKARAEEVLAEGPVSIGGEMVHAFAQTAHAQGSVN